MKPEIQKEIDDIKNEAIALRQMGLMVESVMRPSSPTKMTVFRPILIDG